MGKESENLTESLKKSPQMVTILIVVGAFLFYLYRHDELSSKAQEREDLVAVQRIQRCHSIQEDSTAVMDKLNNTLNSQGNAFHELSVTLRDIKNIITSHNESMSAHNKRMAELLDRLERAEKLRKKEEGS